MTSIILATFEHGGAMWTVSLDRPAHGSGHDGARLVFVRDWIVGGTRRVSCTLDGDLAEMVQHRSAEHVVRRLEEELAGLFQTRRAAHA